MYKIKEVACWGRKSPRVKWSGLQDWLCHLLSLSFSICRTGAVVPLHININNFCCKDWFRYSCSELPQTPCNYLVLQFSADKSVSHGKMRSPSGQKLYLSYLTVYSRVVSEWKTLETCIFLLVFLSCYISKRAIYVLQLLVGYSTNLFLLYINFMCRSSQLIRVCWFTHHVT